jgi:hypothetical protein
MAGPAPTNGSAPAPNPSFNVVRRLIVTLSYLQYG